ncbi:MAG: deoxyribodipyrimidine photo-lyase [Acidobacteriota bacterium]
MNPGIQSTRIRRLNDEPARLGRFVLYWMQQSQRAVFNHALEYAVGEANRLRLPLLVGFGLTESYPEANLRHFRFMLEGLRDTNRRLIRRGIPLVVRIGDPDRVAVELARDAALLVSDRGYLRHQRAWRTAVAAGTSCPAVQVESDIVVPVDVVSEKAEYAAHTIRPKIHRYLDDYLVPLPTEDLQIQGGNPGIRGEDLSDVDAVLNHLDLDVSVEPVSRFWTGGTTSAEERFGRFLTESLTVYAESRNQPQTDHVSAMSPFLHFGQVSPVQLAMEARRRMPVAPRDVEVFLEELIVRRDLAINFVERRPNYDHFSCLPNWAARTLDDHSDDPREFTYDRQTLESAATHDPYWNAAMREMRLSGYMHNHMRMYWGKKILEWSPSPEEAFSTALYLNNRYFLDGRDPSSYANVAWIFGMHDRPWKERPVFGKVRYMNARGLERKCDIRGYIDKVGGLERDGPGLNGMAWDR